MTAGSPAGSWTVKELLGWTTPFFEKKGASSPRLDAELLLAEVLSCERLQLYLDHDRPVDEDERAAFRRLVERRAAGEPVAYLLGRREFYGRSFRIDSRVLVPRPETELLVDAALALIPGGGQDPVLDLCSGSGCIGVTLAAERPTLSVVAVELSPDAAALARENAEQLGVSERYEQREGDLFEALAEGERFAALTANPPYIAPASWEGLPPEVRHEPRMALLAPEEGLALSRRILREGRAFLLPGGHLLLEHGEEQGPTLRAEALALGWSAAEVRRDLAGHDRLLVARA
ncbi:MAG: peptide chain release factor N(5)-glutamine methyltransferase [Deltaproteobacteria bacterium]|nr:peptide chain release factor N(5)-glutamine methyltransferase [Deltaproteobacteria bacterium]